MNRKDQKAYRESTSHRESGLTSLTRADRRPETRTTARSRKQVSHITERCCNSVAGSTAWQQAPLYTNDRALASESGDGFRPLDSYQQPLSELLPDAAYSPNRWENLNSSLWPSATSPEITLPSTNVGNSELNFAEEVFGLLDSPSTHTPDQMQSSSVLPASVLPLQPQHATSGQSLVHTVATTVNTCSEPTGSKSIQVYRPSNRSNSPPRPDSCECTFCPFPKPRRKVSMNLPRMATSASWTSSSLCCKLNVAFSVGLVQHFGRKNLRSFAVDPDVILARALARSVPPEDFVGKGKVPSSFL